MAPVVGFQLAVRRLSEGHRCPDERYIFLTYAGVTLSVAGRKVFSQLIAAEKRYGLPLVTEVMANNKSCMVARLMRYNFRHNTGTDLNGNYRWDPE
jgi:hypothetical protein